MYLRRPWQPFGRIIFAETFMDLCMEPAGWHNWDKPENEQTDCFYEYRYQSYVKNFITFCINRLPYIRALVQDTACQKPVGWCKELVDDEAIPFNMKTFIGDKLRTKLPISACSA
jgi:hypothetical protein